MKYHIVLIMMSTVTSFVGTPCICPEISTNIYCSSKFGCEWVELDNASLLCRYLATPPACSTLISQKNCDATSGCGWTNAGVCSTFTQCSDYSVTLDKGYQCQDKSCIPGQVNNGTVQCTKQLSQQYKLLCSDILDQTLCNSGLFQNSSLQCWWIGNSCTTQVISNCSTITDSQLCQYYGCVYSGQACTAPTCTSIKSESTCTKLVAENTSQIQVCTWSDGACKDLDTSSLAYTTCYTQSYGTYTRQGKTCQACTGQASSSMFSLVVLFIFMIQ